MSSFTTFKQLQHDLLLIGRDLRNFEKGLAKNYREKVKYDTMLRESQFVLKELDLLKDDATVYKLVGPILVKQDPTKPNGFVQQRIGYLTDELNRLNAIIEDLEGMQMSKREKSLKIEGTL